MNAGSQNIIAMRGHAEKMAPVGNGPSGRGRIALDMGPKVPYDSAVKHILVENFPVKLWRRFRIAAIDRGTTARQLLADVVADFLKREQKAK
jgi:hypothetical protein